MCFCTKIYLLLYIRFFQAAETTYDRLRLSTEKENIMQYLNNPFTRDITEYDGEVFTEVRAVEDKIYLSNGAIIKQNNEGKFFDISTNEKYGTVFEASAPDEIGAIIGYAVVTGSSSPDYFAF